MAESLQQLLVTNFGLSPSGYTGSRGTLGYVGSGGTNGYTGSAGASGTGILISNIQVTDSSYTVLDDTAVDVAGGYIKITGSGFASGCSVLINQTAATSVTFISSKEVRAQVPATVAGTYIVYVVNTSGDVAIRVNGITFSATPTWVTGSGLAGIVNTAISIQLSASLATTYSLQTGSSLPSGVTLSNVGLVSGTVSGISSETTYNFTVLATDAELQDSPRAFSLTITVGDVYFNNTTLLLSGNGSMTGNTAVKPFTADASTNNFAVTVNGDTRADAFNPYQAGYYSNYFDGTGDYLNPPSDAAFGFGTGDFTMECWMYPTDTKANMRLWEFGGDADNVDISTASAGTISYYNGTTPVTSSAGVISFNSWNHIALVRSSGTVKVYVNGTSQLTQATTPNSGARTFYLGGVSNIHFQGYISNMRIVKGTAVYTANFTPSITPLTAITNTVLLTCQSNRFIDNSTNAFAITRNGDTAVRALQPFVLPSSVATYGSGYFDGTGDYLTAPCPGMSGTWTIELWFYPTVGGAQQTFVSFNSGGVAGINIWMNPSNQIVVDDGQVASGLFTGGTFTINAWNHVAIVRNGTTTTSYINGVSVGSNTFTPAGVNTINIGRYNGGSYYYVNGYISNLRVVVGTAVYTSAFTPSTSPLTAITNTALLTAQYNGASNNNAFKDSSTNNFAITRNGNTTQGTFSPYGPNWSNFFNGASQLSFSTNSGYAFGTGDFTVECWYYATSNPGYRSLIETRSSNGTSNGWALAADSGGAMYVYSAGFIVSGITVVLNTWNHVAFTRSGATQYLFLNGVLVSSTATARTYSDTNLGIGGVAYTTGEYWTGYLSNVRLIKGTCLYTTTFTPSTTPLTAVSNTTMLTSQSNRFIDNSTNNATITAGTGVNVQRFSPFSPTQAYSTSTTGGSGYFDGTGDYLIVPRSTLCIPGASQNFTIEAWVYSERAPGVTPQQIMGFHRQGVSSDWVFSISSSNYPEFYLDATGTNITSSIIVNPYSWNHIAVVRKNTNTINIYVNGVSGVTATTASTLIGNGANPLSIGSDYNGAQFVTKGYITDARIVNGTALYTSNFVPPTAPLTAVLNTQLLLNYTNAGIIDSTMLNNLETVGNAQISTIQSKFGGSSMYFNGSSTCTIPANTNLNFGTGDFTIEMWVYSASQNSGGNRTIGNGAGASWGANKWIFTTTTPGNLNKFTWHFWNYNSGGSDILVSSSASNNSTWTYVAVTRSGNTFRMFVNGAQEASLTSSASVDGGVAAQLTLGNSGVAGDSNWTGYLDDLRITRGLARYTANFTPPTTAFLAQ